MWVGARDGLRRRQMTCCFLKRKQEKKFKKKLIYVKNNNLKKKFITSNPVNYNIIKNGHSIRRNDKIL